MQINLGIYTVDLTGGAPEMNPNFRWFAEKVSKLARKVMDHCNLPISRFLEFLLQTGQYAGYMEKLVNAFNPATITGLMCRNTIFVSWEGYL